MDPLATCVLGKTAVHLTRLGFGGAQLGGIIRHVSEADAERVLEAAWGGGVRYFDTSPFYGHGQSEHRLGHMLRHKPRDSFVLSTKVGRVYSRPRGDEQPDMKFWVGGLPFVFRFDYTSDGIMRSYEDSLQRLGLNRIDLLLIHDLDSALQGSQQNVARGMDQLDGGGGFGALQALRRAGEIGGIGAGINDTSMIKPFLDRFDVDFFLIAVPYSLVEQDAFDDVLPQCAARGVGLIKGAPYASGILATGAVAGAHYSYAPASGEVLQKVRAIETVCAGHGVPLRAAALQFPLGHESFTTTIPGMLDPAEVSDNLKMLSTPIPAAFWSQLKDEGLVRADAPTP